MPAFTDEQYRFVVERLAEGDMPADIAMQVNQLWPPSAFKAPDCAALTRDKLNFGWQIHFDLHRAAFKAGEPAADIDFRIALLGKWAREDAGRGSKATAAKYLEQIAKEQAGHYGGKGSGATGSNSTGEPVEAIEWTIVDPQNETQTERTASVPAASQTESV